MAKAAWGKKRTCSSCGAHFYDMKKNPAACPKCGTEDNLQPLLKPRRNGPAAKPVPKPAAPAKPVKADETDEVDDVLDADDEDDVLEVDDDGDDDVVVEDDELGDDDDDVSEVKEHLEVDDDRA